VNFTPAEEETMNQERMGRWAVAIAVSAIVAMGAAPSRAGAQIVLGHHYRPHYWDLPVEFEKPFTFPGQTFLYNSTSASYDAAGKKVDGGVPTDTLFGFTIVPMFFKFDRASSWAFAFSMNTYELRQTAPGSDAFEGVGSAIPAFTGWTKPTPNSTVGFDSLLSTPFAVSPKLDTHTWDLFLRAFYDVNVAGWNAEAVVGYQTSFVQTSGTEKPRDQYHLNGRLGYDIKNVSGAGLRVTPYVSADYQLNDENTSYVANVGGGLMVTHKSFTSWSVGYSRSVAGKSATETNAVLAQLWFAL